MTTIHLGPPSHPFGRGSSGGLAAVVSLSEADGAAVTQNMGARAHERTGAMGLLFSKVLPTVAPGDLVVLNSISSNPPLLYTLRSRLPRSRGRNGPVSQSALTEPREALAAIQNTPQTTQLQRPS